ncbi:MAG: D-glycero-D-manno-heptose 1-phosphate guanosyltransferase [uncultured Acidimicrobiales bacterium]|uniref:D-glycero-D-manno-heptose 1-phosphate guanosyltransferase n=1 Tax=uncultured Acidimicrobiales bacterium TaxID=310071 RepID=A0A6J4I382_9ACTN|nr:MAG: D-glycero-D-manno-heptose 1-phosphate guanosyltransferase [uncultured Acidimicrobiales bacterium]
MRAVVLVGGKGTRLRPLTYRTPKQLLAVAEVTIIERVVGHLRSHGVTEVVLSMGYQPDAFRLAFPDERCAGVPLSYAVESEPLDTAGGIAFAARAAGIDDTFIAVNGDVLTDLDLGALVAMHRARGGQATIGLTPVEDPSAFGVVPTDDENRVLAFIEKPAAADAPTNYINAGFYVLEPSVLDRIPVAQPYKIETQVFPAMAAEGALFALQSDAYWTDAGTPELFLQANLDLIAGRRDGPPAPHARQRTHAIWTLGAAIIDGHVDGPALIGDAAYIASGATVHASVIGAGARIEAGAVVNDSVVLAGAVIRAEAHVDGSIVGDGAVIGRGAKLSGLSVVQGEVEVPEGADLHGARVGNEG